MQTLEQVLAVAQTIYKLCQQAKSNKKQCCRLENRIKMLLLPLVTLQKQPDKSLALQTVVEELGTMLKNARDWVTQYSQLRWLTQVFKANSIKEEFELINDRLGDSATHISLLLDAEHREILAQQREMIAKQIDMLSQFFAENTRKKENQEDLEEDLKEHIIYLKSHAVIEVRAAGVSRKAETRDQLSEGKTRDQLSEGKTSDQLLDVNTRRLIAELSEISIACHQPNWDITEIPATDLKRGDLLLERATHYLYRGELQSRPVAIKVFKDQNVRSEEFIRRTFQNESQTMKKFECLNILQLYGICIDNSGPETCYSLVMELCENGTLRELLQNEQDMNWAFQRIPMALDAARALYRLHRAEEKAIFHGNLSSSKYLVDRMYCVKLSAFGLAKTESSIWSPSNMETKKDRELDYIAPETWQDINSYDKRSEMYSFGVVMYEIATGKLPFQDLQVTEDNLGEMQEKWWASWENDLPSKCPRMFRDLIKRLIQKNPNDRPSAGVTMDLLVALLNQQNGSEAFFEMVEMVEARIDQGLTEY